LLIDEGIVDSDEISLVYPSTTNSEVDDMVYIIPLVVFDIYILKIKYFK